MKVIVTTLVLLSLASSVLSASYPWKYCPGQDQSRIDITDVVINPAPIIKGKPAKFEVLGNAKQDLAQKNGRVDVYSGGTRFFSTAVGGVYSVSQGGKYDYAFSYTIPSFVPPGDYEVRISYADSSAQTFACVSVDAHF